MKEFAESMEKLATAARMCGEEDGLTRASLIHAMKAVSRAYEAREESLTEMVNACAKTLPALLELVRVRLEADIEEDIEEEAQAERPKKNYDAEIAAS